MEESKKNLRSLTVDELTRVINLYPWFGGARKELCARMARVGGSEWGKTQYSDTAMYVVSRTLVSDIMRSARREDYSDKDVERLIKEYIRPDTGALRQAQGPERLSAGPLSSAAEYSSSSAEHTSSVAEPVEAPGRTDVSAEAAETREYSSAEPEYRRTVRVAGGDFFSPEQYAAVRKDEDNVFSNFKSERYDEPEGRRWEDPEFGFCTETLAAIYADQGYFVEAKKIYSRLILRYPEKSAYFASLIENLRQEN